MSTALDMHALNARLLRFRSHPEQEDAHALAEDLIAARRYGDARGVAISAQTDDDADDARLLVIEARAWYMDRDPVRAQVALVRAARLDPDCPEAFRWLGEVLIERGDPIRAERALQRAVELAPHDAGPERLLQRARQLARQAPGAKPVEPEPPRVLESGPVPTPLASPSGSSPGGDATDVQDDAPTSTFRRTPEPVDAPVIASQPSRQAAFDDVSGGALDAAESSRSSRRSSPSGLGWLPAARSPAAGSGSSPGALPAAPARLVPSATGDLAAAAHSSSPAVPASPASRTSAAGALPAAPAASRSSVGGVPAAASRASSPGTLQSAFGISSPAPAPVRRPTPAALQSPAELPPGPASRDEAPDPEPSAAQAQHVPEIDSAPGVAEPAVSARPISASWDAPSAMATWPSLEPLSEAPPAPAAPLTDCAGIQLGLGASTSTIEVADDVDVELPFDSSAGNDGEPDTDPGFEPELAPEIALGATAHEPDEPEAPLRSPVSPGVFEPQSQAADEAAAAPEAAAKSVPSAGKGLGKTFAGIAITTLLLFGGGYFGWQQWIAHRHAGAAELVAQARAAAFDGDHARLVEAERLLQQARHNHPRSAAVPPAELFVHAQRVLESGGQNLGALRSALSRAERLNAGAGHLALARAVLSVYSGDEAEAQPLIEQALAAAKGDPALLYAIGRLQQRLGHAEALAQLRASAAAAPDLIAAALALAELHYHAGEAQQALAALDAVLARKPTHLRARLWRAFVTGDDADPAAALAALDELAVQSRQAAPFDRILWALSRARLLRRQGATDPAAEALREALAAGASEPRSSALIAAEARRAGQLGVAQQAASQALAAAPQSADYRVLLASILLARGDGERASQLLSDLPSADPALMPMRARAALQTGDPEALRAALAAIDARLTAGDESGELAALRLRLRAAIEPSAQLLGEAQALARRSPADPRALHAQGEIALALHEPKPALAAFAQLTQLTPDDAEAHYLLGRARTMAADAEGAEQALRRALELSPGNLGALRALAGLLHDSGKHAEAEALYQELAQHGALSGRLGRAEALIALGRLDDAAAQVAELPEAARDQPVAREVAAKVALARGKPGAALSLLGPLVEAEQQRRPSTFALYGDALYAADQVNAAAGAYESALALDGGLPEALLGRAVVHLRAERPGDALELLEPLRAELTSRLRAPAFHARVLTQLGRAYVQREKRGDGDRAREALRKAVRLPNPPAEAYFWLGEALGGRKTPESAAALKRYIELEPDGYYAERAKRALGPLL